MTGIDLIALERHRQITVEGYTIDHDKEHTAGELALAAAMYATPIRLFKLTYSVTNKTQELQFSDAFPAGWNDKRLIDGPAYQLPDPESYTDAQYMDLLIKAGALIAAEIDRLQAK